MKTKIWQWGNVKSVWESCYWCENCYGRDVCVIRKHSKNRPSPAHIYLKQPITAHFDLTCYLGTGLSGQTAVKKHKNYSFIYEWNYLLLYYISRPIILNLTRSRKFVRCNMHQTLCEQTVAVSFEAETNAGMAFETYGNPWDVRESAMNDTHSPGSGSMSLIQQLYVLFLSHTHT